MQGSFLQWQSFLFAKKSAVNYYIHEKNTITKITCATDDKLKSSIVHFTCKTKYFLGFFHGDNFLSMSGLPLRYVMLLKDGND